MNTNDLCTEEQAIALAGVSARTLQRFCESGYLTTSQGNDGKLRYARKELQDIFGGCDSDEPPQESAEYSNDHSANSAATSYYSDVDATVSTHQPKSPTSVEGERRPTENINRERSSQQAAMEVDRLKNLLAIQERMLDSKDDEIADLKNQRAWLRERIEKLEEKSDRDQILLLSETQTIRSLLAYQESRKSGFRQFLEWVGIVPGAEFKAIGPSHSQTPQGTSGTRTIEIRQAANGD